MFKQLFFFLVFSIFISGTNAQKGNNVVSINAETSIPVFQKDHGYGFFLKGAYGIHKSGQLTISAGVSKFNSKNSIEKRDVTTRLVPILLGYKHNLQKFFIEPKIGIGELGGRILNDGDYQRPSVAAMFGGLSSGYTFKRFNVGINFLTVHGIENASAGIWYNKSFHYTSFYLGYDLFPNSGH
jgi:hypothetical protein